MNREELIKQRRELRSFNPEIYASISVLAGFVRAARKEGADYLCRVENHRKREHPVSGIANSKSKLRRQRRLAAITKLYVDTVLFREMLTAEYLLILRRKRELEQSSTCCKCNEWINCGITETKCEEEAGHECSCVDEAHNLIVCKHREYLSLAIMTTVWLA